MTTPHRWPTDDELSQLLQGRLPALRQAEIEAILEQEEDLRERLERIAGGSSWIGRAGGSTGHDDIADDFALHAAMDGLKAQASDATIHQGVERGSMTLAFLSPSDNPAALGKLLHYEVLELIGTGGFGLVLKAHDPKLNRLVAIKVLAPHLASHATARRRFTREAHTAASINHPHVVTIHAIEENERPPFLVMEYVAGQSLQQLLDRHGPLELPQILRIGAQMAAGLAAAHKQGQIHRDVKPGNILLENGVQRVKITDFGLARAADDASLTQSGVIAGTPQYMAPEQARGENVDYRADLFSLGSVLYTMCTGRAAFRADSAVAVLKRVCDDQPRPIRVVNPEVPSWLAAIVERLMAKRRDERFQSAQEVCELLEKCLAHVQQPELVALPETASRLARSASPAQPQASAVSSSSSATSSVSDRERIIEEAQRRVRIPAIGLIVVAVLNILMMGMFTMTTTTHVVYSNGEYVPRAAWLGVVSIVLMLFMLATAVVLVLGGVGLHRLRAWPLVLVAAILSMMSISVLGLGLVFGIWTLVLLFDPRIQRAMRLSAEVTPEALTRSSLQTARSASVPPVATKPLLDDSSEMRAKVWWPATALLWVGVLNVASLAAMALIFALFASRGHAPVLILPMVVGVLAIGGVVIVAGAYYMRELRCWPLAVGAAILAMIIGPGSIIGLAVGIWALVVLMQADVRAAFAGRVRQQVYNNDDKKRQSRAVLLTVAAGISIVLFGVGAALLAVGGWVVTSRSTAYTLPPAPVPHAELRVEADVSNVIVSVEQTNYVNGKIDQWQTSQDATQTPFHVEMMIAPGNYTVRAIDSFNREVFHQEIVLAPAEREVVQVRLQVPPVQRRPAWPSRGYLQSQNVASTALSPDGKQTVWALTTGEAVVCNTHDGREQHRFRIGDPSAITFSPDGKLIAFLGSEKDKAPASELRVALYTLESQETRFLPLAAGSMHENLRALAFSADGQSIFASVSQPFPKQREVDPDFKSGLLRWKVATGEELPTLKSQDGIIQQIAFPAGINDIVVSISNWPGKRGASIVCWDVEKGEALQAIHWPERVYDAVALTPQGGWVYASAYDSTQSQGVPPGPNISILATRDAKDRRGLFPEAGRVALHQRATALAISRDGKVFATYGEPGKIELWLVHALRPTRLCELTNAFLGEHAALRFTDDNRFLIASGSRLEMTQWDVSRFTTLGDQAEAPLPTRPPQNATGPLPLPNFAPRVETIPPAPTAPAETPPPSAPTPPTPAPAAVESGGGDKVIEQVQPTRNVSMRSRLDLPAEDVQVQKTVLSPDGKRVAWSLKSGKIVVHNIEDNYKVIQVETGDPRLAAFSPDGKFLAVVGAKPFVMLFNLERNESARQLKLSGKHYDDDKFKTLERVKTLAFSPDSATLAVSSAYLVEKKNESDSQFESVVHRWKVADGEELLPLRSQQGIIEQIAFPPNSSERVVTASNNAGQSGGAIAIWDISQLTTQTPRLVTLVPQREYDALALAPHGNWVYASVNDSRLNEGVASGPSISILAAREIHQGLGLIAAPGRIALAQRATALAVSSDGKVLAVYGAPGKIQMWSADPQRPQKLGELTGADLGEHPALGFTDDNRSLIATGASLKLLQWDVARFPALADQAAAAIPIQAESTQPITGTEELDKLVEFAQQYWKTMQERHAAGLNTPDELAAAELKYYERLASRYEALRDHAKLREALAEMVRIRKEDVQRGETLLEVAAITKAEVDIRRAALIEAELRLKQAPQP